MLAEERRQEILRILNIEGSVHVKELSKTLEVTEETIRRDLEVLNNKKLLKRTHGGAIPLKNNEKNLELSFNIRTEKNVEEKQIIATKAVSLINEGETIFLDASSTSLFLARELNKFRNITVLTNSIRIVYELTNNNNITVISTGGILRSNSLSFVGPLANDTIKKYYADKFFASCKGISTEHGATDSNELEIEVKKNMLNQAREIIILADYTKFEEIGLTQFASINQINTIITDNSISNNMKNSFEKMGIEIL